jgi:hypothetical protein
MSFFALKNRCSQDAFPVDAPWDLPSEGKTRDGFEAWLKTPSTETYLISGVEGASPAVRVSKEAGNRPFARHAYIASYRSPLVPGIEEAWKQKAPSDWWPSWLIEPVEVGARLVWMFEEPVLFHNEKHAQHFDAYLARKLNPSGWLAGHIGKSVPSDYVHFGNKWRAIAPGCVIPKETLFLWSYESTKKVVFDEDAGRIPIDVVAQTVQSRFPGRWSGPFEIGSRGIQFWEPTATDDRAAIVREDGMTCFSSRAKPFTSWREIFGGAWFDQVRGDKVSRVMENLMFDSVKCEFWHKRSDGVWSKITNGLLNSWFKGPDVRISTVAANKDEQTEAERVLLEVRDRNSFSAALPYIFRPHGPLMIDGKLIMNTAMTRVMDPAPAGILGDNLVDGAKKYFPILWSFMHSFLKRVNGDAVQTRFLWAWMKRAYLSGYEMNPTMGQCLVIVGAHNTGKSLLSRHIFSKIMGGGADAEDVALKGSRWTSNMLHSAVGLIDDAEVHDKTGHSRAAAANMIKKLVASPRIMYDNKYSSTGEVEWRGRLMILCNNDPQSMQIVPPLTRDNRDKICMLKTVDGIKMPPIEYMQQVLPIELPYLCRYLIDMPWPVGTRDVGKEPRFYIKPYRHPDLEQIALQAGMAHVWWEMLLETLSKYREANPKLEFWSGTANMLFSDIATCIGNSIGRYTTSGLASALHNMIHRKFPIKTLGKEDGLMYYKIPLDLGRQVVKMGLVDAAELFDVSVEEDQAALTSAVYDPANPFVIEPQEEEIEPQEEETADVQ